MKSINTINSSNNVYKKDTSLDMHKVFRYGSPEAKGADPRYVIGKPSDARAKQFMPFKSLRGYEELVEDESEMRDIEDYYYSTDDESC